MIFHSYVKLPEGKSARKNGPWIPLDRRRLAPDPAPTAPAAPAAAVPLWAVAVRMVLRLGLAGWRGSWTNSGTTSRSRFTVSHPWSWCWYNINKSQSRLSKVGNVFEGSRLNLGCVFEEFRHILPCLTHKSNQQGSFIEKYMVGICGVSHSSSTGADDLQTRCTSADTWRMLWMCVWKLGTLHPLIHHHIHITSNYQNAIWWVY